MRDLSDDKLREKLRSFGYEPGPITPATRQVYERKLDRMLKNSNLNVGSALRSRASQTKNAERIKIEDGHSSISSFSKSPFTNTSRAAIGHTPFQLDSQRHFSNVSFRSSFTGPNSSPQENPGHTPNAGVRSPLRNVNTDSVHNSPTPSNSDLRMRHKISLSNPTSLNFNYQSGCSPPSNSRSSPGRRISTVSDLDPGIPDSPTGNPHRTSFSSSWFSRASLPCDIMSEDSSTVSENIVHRTFHTDTKSPHHHLPEEYFDRTFFSRFFGFSFGNQVPNLILFCGVILLAVIASSYFLLKDKHSNVGRIADLQKVICLPEDHCDGELSAVCLRPNCINSQDLPLILRIVHCLFEILSRFAGENLCGESVGGSRMETETAKRLVKRHFASYSTSPLSAHQVDALWDGVLLIITEVGQKHLKIAAYGADGQKLQSWQEVTELESMRPYIPGSCRLRLLTYSLFRFLSNLLWLLLVVTVVCGLCYIVYRFKQSQQNRSKRRTMRVREIVREVSCILQQQLQQRQSNPAEPPYVPVSVIKERLAHTTPDLAELWTEVEHYVHLVEGSILVQEWRGVGETWQWQAGSGWQGSALLGTSQRLPFTTPPTECLKVRNMFTRESLDVSSKRRLKRELLSRIVECGPILHIGLDSQNNQGLVYIKCASPAVAGRVFEAIHANYFDSHLLTVKFLRASKYHLRFPDAYNATTPLSAADFE